MSGSPCFQCPAAMSRRDDVADLGGGDLGGVIGRAEPDRVQRQRPRRAARLQRHDPGVRPARDHLRVPLPARVAVAEQPLRAGLRVRPQPVAHVAGQPDPPVVPPAQRDRRPVPAAAGRSGPPRSSARRRRRRARGGTPAPGTAPPACAPAPAGTPARRHLEQRVPAHPQRAVQLAPEPRQHAPSRDPPRPPSRLPGHNESHGHRLASSEFCGRNPKIIKRWPSHVTTTRRTAQATQDDPDNMG